MKSSDIIRVENSLRTDDIFTIRWNITYLCNYSCKFCIQGDKNMHILKSKGESREIREKICDNLIKFIETEINGKYKEIEIYPVGGEITILPDFLEIMTKLAECKFKGPLKIHITTNLSADKELLSSLVKIFNFKYPYQRILEVSASYYKEYTTEDEFINKVKLLYGKDNLRNKTIGKLFNNKNIVNKIRKILGKKLFRKGRKVINKIQPIYVNIGYPLCTDEDCSDYIKFVKKYGHVARKINFTIIREYEKSISTRLKKKIDKKYYKSDIIKVTDKNGKQYFLSNTDEIAILLDEDKRFNPKNYMCNVGINSINIDNLGIVSRCLLCKNDTIIGDMKEGNIDLPTTRFLCTSTKCACNFYNLIEKV